MLEGRENHDLLGQRRGLPAKTFRKKKGEVPIALAKGRLVDAVPDRKECATRPRGRNPLSWERPCFREEKKRAHRRVLDARRGEKKAPVSASMTSSGGERRKPPPQSTAHACFLWAEEKRGEGWGCLSPPKEEKRTNKRRQPGGPPVETSEGKGKGEARSEFWRTERLRGEKGTTLLKKEKNRSSLSQDENRGKDEGAPFHLGRGGNDIA